MALQTATATKNSNHETIIVYFTALECVICFLTPIDEPLDIDVGIGINQQGLP